MKFRPLGNNRVVAASWESYLDRSPGGELTPIVESPQGHDLNSDHPMTPRYSEVSSTPSTSPKGDMTVEPSPTSKFDKRESYKAQRKNYRREKKRVAKELSTTLKDPSIVVLGDWLKVRGTLKGWTKLWCVLKPGMLLLYKSPKTHKVDLESTLCLCWGALSVFIGGDFNDNLYSFF
ncbi:hypothetical protein JTE90_024150 [Oedothorax gibbosus]|uniref:Oxysterol-binding protein n=1 Tax=Oedothorax gibbosus TaxID=931172 RepID=A0AAV6U4T1_9ARAC|nr:hypothetical protein JTE90_024150 [Oedothorax gibbosus]